MKYSVDEKLYVAIGGVEQNIRIRSTDEALPVILFVHGGPGVCDRHWVLSEQSPLANTATLVCWDQRGAGLSYYKNMSKESFSLDRMIEDAHELLLYLKNRFRRKKICLWRHMWRAPKG